MLKFERALLPVALAFHDNVGSHEAENVEVVADGFGMFHRQAATVAPGKTYTLTATPR